MSSGVLRQEHAATYTPTKAEKSETEREVSDLRNKHSKFMPRSFLTPFALVQRNRVAAISPTGYSRDVQSVLPAKISQRSWFRAISISNEI